MGQHCREICQLLAVWCLFSTSSALSANTNITSYLDITKYTLNYLIDFKQDIFNGTVDIDIYVKKPDATGKILVLDIEDLSVLDISLKDATSVMPVPFDAYKDNVTLHLPVKLQSRGSYTVSLSFFGKILDTNNEGIFKYQARDKKYITTNLFPFYARRAFPCFNDAFIKSIFSLTILIEGAAAGVKPLTNTPLLSKNDENTVFQFKDTPKIPLHNLFFTVGYYEKYAMSDNIYVSRNSITFNNEIAYTLANEVYKNFLKISKIPSVKIVAIPGLPRKTITGYGIVAISENNLFMDLKRVTTEQRKISLLNIFSALYKLFYGSCLTPKAWSDSWIVESIPIYLKYNGLSEIDSWKDPFDYISYDIQQSVLLSNSDPTSGPIVDETITTEEQVLNFLGSSPMLKGAGVLIMLESVLSKGIVINVLTDFFSESILKPDTAVSTEDFVNFFANHKEVVDKIHQQLDLKEVLYSWLKQGGYPYLQTKRAGSGVTIDERVFIRGTHKPAQKLWKFPIFYTSGSKPTFHDDQFFWLLLEDDRSVSLNFTLTSNEWFVINVNGTGPYRVNYEENDWMNLAYAMNGDYTTFPTSTRSKLISDAFAMLFAGHAKPYTILSFLTYLQREVSLTPWLSALDGFKYLRSLLYSTELRNDLDAYMTNVLYGIYTKLGIENNTMNNFDGILRQKVVSATCNHGYQGCISETHKDYLKMIDDHSGYSPSNDVRPVIVCNGIRDIEVNKWIDLFNATFDDINILGEDIRKVYYEALACPRNKDNNENDSIEKFLQLIFKPQNKKVISRSDVHIAFQAIYTNPEHTSQALNYFVVYENTSRIDLTVHDKIRMIHGIAPYLTKQGELDMLHKYLEVIKPAKEIQDAVMLAMSTFNKTQNFMKRNYNNIKLALQLVNPPTPTTQTPGTGTPTVTPSPATKPPTSSPGPTTNATVPPTTPTTGKPNSAPDLSNFNLITLLMVYLSLYIII